MISQIRIYTINKGEMDNFLKHFKEDIMVLHEKDRRTHRRNLGESAAERIHLGPNLQRQGNGPTISDPFSFSRTCVCFAGSNSIATGYESDLAGF